MTKTESANDRRRFLRLPLGIKVGFRILDDTIDTAGLRTTQVKDLSEGGILLKSPYKLVRGDVLQIKLDFAVLGRKLQVAAIGKVIRCQKASAGGYLVGTQFLKIHPIDYLDLKAFIDKQAKRETAKPRRPVK